MVLSKFLKHLGVKKPKLFSSFRLPYWTCHFYKARINEEEIKDDVFHYTIKTELYLFRIKRIMIKEINHLKYGSQLKFNL